MIEDKIKKMCDLGCGQEAEFFYKSSGKSYCCKMGNGCPIRKEQDSIKKKNNYKLNPNYIGFQKGESSWNKGLTKENSSKIKEMGQAISLSFAINGDQRINKNHTEESKNKLREKMNERYASGWQATSCGRAKSYPYENPSEGLVHLTGTWEVDFAKALDQACIQWFRNKKRFDYIKPDGKDATYLPDFYIPKYNTYIETKGYETDLDRSKWEQFHEPLIVLRKIEIFQIKKWLKDSVEITEHMMMKLCNLK